MSSFNDFWKNAKTAMNQHSPEIAIIGGCVGVVASTVLLVSETVHTTKEVINEEARRGEKLSKKDIFKLAWKRYIPGVSLEVLSLGSIIFGGCESVKRLNAATMAYAISDRAYKELSEETKEVLGEKKAQDIHDQISKKKIDDNPLTSEDMVIDTGNGSTLCYDTISGRYFYSDIEILRRAENDLNRILRSDMYLSLNDLYSAIGLAGVKLGEDLGWNIDKGYLDFRFSSMLTQDGRPCLVLDYSVGPIFGYQI